jgi:hypothetical protein
MSPMCSMGIMNINKGRLCLFRYVYRAVRAAHGCGGARLYESCLVRNCGSPRLLGSASPTVAALPRAFKIICPLQSGLMLWVAQYLGYSRRVVDWLIRFAVQSTPNYSATRGTISPGVAVTFAAHVQVLESVPLIFSVL